MQAESCKGFTNFKTLTTEMLPLQLQNDLYDFYSTIIIHPALHETEYYIFHQSY